MKTRRLGAFDGYQVHCILPARVICWRGLFITSSLSRRTTTPTSTKRQRVAPGFLSEPRP